MGLEFGRYGAESLGRLVKGGMPEIRQVSKEVGEKLKTQAK